MNTANYHAFRAQIDARVTAHVTRNPGQGIAAIARALGLRLHTIRNHVHANGLLVRRGNKTRSKIYHWLDDPDRPSRAGDPFTDDEVFDAWYKSVGGKYTLRGDDYCRKYHLGVVATALGPGTALATAERALTRARLDLPDSWLSRRECFRRAGIDAPRGV